MLTEITYRKSQARAGGRARAKTLNKAQRSAIAHKAAYARWHKVETSTE